MSEENAMCKDPFNIALVLGTVLSYFALSNQCLTYAVVTGEAHHASAPAEHHHAHNDGEKAHDHHGDHQHSHGAGEEGSCCLNFSAVSIGTVGKLIDFKPSFFYSTLTLLLTRFDLSDPRVAYYQDHHPPGRYSRDLFFSPTSLRAPPL